MKSKTIRLSETTHLNDSGEMSFGITAARKEIKRLAREAGHYDGTVTGNGEVLAERYEREALEAFDAPGLSDTFVASFSKRGDLLSQWRSYCPTGGVAIGFDHETLRTCFRDLGLPGGVNHVAPTLPECVYREPKDSYSVNPTAPDSGLLGACAIFVTNRNKSYQQHARSDVLRFCPIFKHPGFAEEAEVRGIYTRKWGEAADAIQVRAAPQRLVRYVEAGWKGTPVHPAVEICALCAVRLGPVETHERPALIDAIRRATASAGLADIRVDWSETPLRRT